MTNFLHKLTMLDDEINHSTVHRQVEEIKQIDHQVAKGEPLIEAPAKLGLLPDQFEEILEEIGNNQKRKLTDINNLFNNFRQYLSLKYGVWSVPNLKTAHLIKNRLHIDTALEIMAGNAYWSKALENVEIQTISTDSLEWAKTSSTGAEPFHPVINLEATEAIKHYSDVDLIICSWSPNFGKSDIAAIDTWHKCSNAKHFIFIGEEDGATNSPEFWQNNWFKQTAALKAINDSFQSFDFIDERIFEIDNEF
ncbi:SAM-dependent methyltransferase [Lactobacillus helveticus]|uniref:SAM-dependent methyltransferase n=2 Tax=Lactobacillus helveticus TaxID=1587 RepID=A8YVK8_LACH4|nr:hypothetical protein [Lactobacillus helveticus]ABX27295.1 hypothetical protein lhv_1281 [Lactobacillus helveticus DPC 4571]MDY0990626.1 SAM-dependent methyltransferase [Lactobacillus helveticus]MDY1001306.1 SAM-dependent methyltransferase [Lactobacillus helveticus]MEB2873147.1 SAM-dependent methyltransferase [Lactobacillus helveticus]CDI58043.1 Putative uncharacterized protein [Lactobacillus helveticus CIRM-BIA 951]